MSIQPEVVMNQMHAMACQLFRRDYPDGKHEPKQPETGQDDLFNTIVRQHGEVLKVDVRDDSHMEFITVDAILLVEVCVTNAMSGGRWYWRLHRARRRKPQPFFSL